MNTKLIKVISIFLIAFYSVGCATIFKGSNADIRVNSAPAGARVYVNEIDKGKTPTTLSLKRDDSYVLHFKKEGYKDVKLEVQKKFDAATTIVGNLFSWWVLGVVVDVASGAAYSLTPADVNAHMEQLKNAGLIKEGQAKKNEIFVFMMTQEQWNKIKAAK